MTARYESARRHYVWSRLSRDDVDSGYPLLISAGRGVRVRDVDDNEYLDLTSSASRASSLGYGDERMTAALTAQAERLHYAGTGFIAADIAITLAERLAELPPSGLETTVFSGSGSEANEVALKLAKIVQRENGKPRAFKVISRWNDYHGSVGLAQDASDWLAIRVPAEPGAPGFSRIPAPTCDHCPFGLEHPSCNLRCADFLADQIEHEGPELVAAFLIEPIAQANGVQLPPPGYLERIREICDGYGVLFIADELITGFGRCGSWFAVEHWGVQPDIVTLGKGVTAGYFPLAATRFGAAIHDTVSVLPDVHTYGGHPVGAAAALAAIAIYEQDGLIERARELGADLLDCLQQLTDVPAVTGVRGLGMWCALDFSGDGEEPPTPPQTLRAVVMRARALGVLVCQNGTAIELAPALNIAREDLHEGLERFGRAVREVCVG
jgi:adenosylmethionine-8-amino-7-oxononanoate aminotransferase